MLLLAAAMLLPSNAQGQGNYVYVNNQTATNAVSAYSVSTTGALTQLPSSPFSTGGVGANVVCYGLNRTAVSGVNNLLFVANTGDLTISVFQISPATGALTLAPGSPFASGLTLDSCQGMSLAVTPDGNFLMAASNGSIRTFSVAASGALAPLSTTPNCCSPIASMAISPDGRFLALSNESSVSVFTIAAGVLTPVTGSPFPKTGTGTLSGLDFSCSGNLLYGGEATGSPTITDAWTVNTTAGPLLGALTPTSGSPFHTAGNDSNIVLLSPDNSLLFESNQFTNSVNSFSVQANGNLTNLGKFGGSTAVHLPVGMATDSSGTFLYVADDNFGVAVFRINAGGILSPVSDTAINVPGEIQDVAAYPPRSCASADLSLLMSAAPNPVVAGGPIVYTLTITNNGPSPASAVVSDTLPASTGPGGTIPIVTGNGVQRVNTVPGTSVVTVTTSVPHQLFPGEQISITGVPDPLSTVPSLNATGFLPDPSFVTASTTVATVPTATSFTYNQTLATSQFPTPVFSIVASTGAKRAGGAVTITTTRNYAFVPGTTVTIAGVADTSFNGSFTVASAPTQNTFTFAQAGPDTSSGGGTATFPIVVAATDTSGGGNANSPGCTVTGSAANFCGSLRAPTIPLVAVPGASRLGNVVTITTLIAHQLKVGNKVTIAGVADSSFNGTPTIASVPTTTSFTFSQAGANATSGGGTVTFSGVQKAIAAASPGITRISNVVSAASTVPHQLQVGDMVNIAGVLNASFNGLFTVASTPSTTAFTFNQTGSNAVSGGGSIATRQTQIIAFPLLASGETETATLIATTSSTTANGTVISNTATISNKSVVDPNPADNSATATVTVSLQAATTITVPNATGPYGGFAVLSATLTNSATGAPVAGKIITFTLIPTNTVYSGTTNASGVATVSAALGTFSVGTHPSAFTASFGGDPSFGASSSVGTLIVTKAQLTVTADPQSRLYGDPNPPLTYTITGFVNGDTIAVVSGSGSCNTTAIATSPVGPYPITCTQGTLAATNYVFVFVDGTLTVNPAPLTVTVANASRAYGAANPVFTGTITGLKNADVITATYSTTATPASPVGTYPITATLVDPGNVLGNYVVTNTPGTLTVTPAALTVIPNNAARLYGDPNPAFTGVIVGIQNGDNITATYATTATLTSPVGNYPIVATLVDPTNKLGNYAVTLNTGTLVVSPAPLTVTVANATRPIGSANPVFTGTITGIKNGDNITDLVYSTH